jgi:fatty-acyl-CoA synthase
MLRSLGVGKGDRVAMLSMNCVEYLDLWFACGKLGAVLQTLNFRLTPGELGALLDDGEPVVLVYGPDFVDSLRSIRQAGGASSVRRFIALDDARRAGGDDIPFTLRAQHDSAPLSPSADVLMSDPWVICYTGGTTGLPKGAVLTHGSVTWNALNTVTSWGLVPSDVTILNAPLFHTGGLNVFTAPLAHIGGTSIVCKTFDPAQVFDLVEGAGVTIYFGVPSMFVMMLEHPRWASANLSRLRFVVSGGAPCPLPIFERFWERGVEFKTGYGLTEAGPNTFWLPSEQVRRKPGSVGVPLFHVDVKVVGEGGRELGPDEVGELHVRGGHVFAGYFRRPEETKRAFDGEYLKTGDLARRDADGCYYIVGRSKDMIISGGENIYPAEVESVLAAHPSVIEVALIGVQDEKWGEVGRAVLVARPGETASEEEILAFCRERLARYKVPKSVVFVEALPKTGAGKVDKRALGEQFGGSGR